MNRLRALLLTIGVLTVGGIVTRLVVVRPDATPEELQELRDFLTTEQFDPLSISCQGRDLCQSTRADGGLSPRYVTGRLFGGWLHRTLWERFPDGGAADAGTVSTLIARFPRRVNRDCFEPIGPPDEACQVVGATFDDGGSPGFDPEPSRCACRERGKVCRYQLEDGGTPLMNFAQTYYPPFAGAGCVRKVCAEAAGEVGQSMPTECL